MSMKIKKAKYIFKQAFQSVWRNRMMGLASIGSVTAVLVILGFILLIVLNINNITTVTRETFDEIAVYLVEDLSDSQIGDMNKKFAGIEGVMNVVYRTKEQALNDMKEEWGDDASLLEGLRKNPLPNTYVIQLTDVKYAESVMEKLNSYKDSGIGIEDITYYKDAVNSLISISSLIKKIGTVLIIILLCISVFIISNTIKITVLNRRKEIELMQYIGATNGYVRGPFMIEGVTLGLIGAIIAIILVMIGYNYFITYMSGRYFALLAGVSSYVVSIDMIIKDIIIIFMTIGVGIGVLGSLLSLKKFLSV